ncbi:MAG: ABC transporter permease, partial [Candidatus Latescibacteria bacterium]|nr:ABC transporter permease [Candidatus Latescibacterota bacterium]
MKQILFSPLLFGNYVKLAFRHLQKHRAYCAIHIAGLAVGLACLISIGLFVEYELRYDQFHHKRDRIFRILREIRVTGQPPLVSVTTSGPLGPALQNDFPEIEQAVRVWAQKRIWIQHEQSGFFETLWLADSHLFEVFTFPLIQGDPKTVLQTPTSVVISQRLAQKYFGKEDPIGKRIQATGGYFTGKYEITGIMKDMPHHSTLQIDLVTATRSTGAARWWWDTWLANRSWFPVQTYIVLSEGHNAKALGSKLPKSMARYMGAKTAEKNTYFLQPLSRIYLYSFADFGTHWNWVSDLPEYGNINHLILFSTIALLVLLIACINFMNLATARSATRTREVGLRKVVGANRSQLIAQFLGESVFLSFPALLLALILVQLMLPSLTALTGKKFSLIALLQMRPEFLLVLIALTLFVGLIAGSYPALYLSRFKPVDILKGVLG